METICLLLAAALAAIAPSAIRADGLTDILQDAFTYRNIGPFRAGSWVPDVAVPTVPEKAHLYTFYVAARNGGVWKTTNNGITFTPLFEDKPYLSVGCVSVDPTDENVVWVGSGDASCTRSALRGDGIYKSTDGGKSFQHLGLEDSHHIARVVVNPASPNTVYVAAMGHLFSTNEERGVFKTTDGGKTWKKVLYVDDRTGAIDLAMVEHSPDTLYAAMCDCQRVPGYHYDGGPGSVRIFKTTDGGATWQKLAGGLPTGNIGRIGLALYQKSPNIIIHAIVENRNGTGAAGGGAGGQNLSHG